MSETLPTHGGCGWPEKLELLIPRVVAGEGYLLPFGMRHFDGLCRSHPWQTGAWRQQLVAPMARPCPRSFHFHPPFSPTPRLLVHPSSHPCGDPLCFDRTHALRATILRTRLPSLCSSFTWRSSSHVRSLLAHEGEGRSSGRARGRGGGGDGEICPSCWEEQATMWRVEPCARLDVACMRVLT